MIRIAHPLLEAEEEAAVLRVLASGQLAQGEQVAAFERRFADACQVREAIAVSSGTSESVQTPIVRPGHRHVYHQYTIRVPHNRDQWSRQLRARGVGTAVHYPLAIHQQPLYRKQIDTFRCFNAREMTDARYKGEYVRLPVTEMAAGQVLSLPVHPALSTEDLSTIVREVRALCD